MGASFNLELIHRSEFGDWRPDPSKETAIVSYDGRHYTYVAPGNGSPREERYAFCIAISIAFEADYDFVPVWDGSRIYSADDWPRDGYSKEYNHEVISDPRQNWNAIT